MYKGYPVLNFDIEFLREREITALKPWRKSCHYCLQAV